MVFSDLFFIFVFLPSFLCCYLLAAYIDKQRSDVSAIGNNTIKNIVLTIFSLIFYAWGEPVYVFLMLGCVAINYLIGRAIDRDSIYRKWCFIAGILVNISILGVFKYTGFFVQTLQQWGISVSAPNISLPIGISFYTFQSLSYLIDVYRRESPSQRRFIDLLLYISMFPQLIAGPIVRYNTVAKEILHRKVCAADISEGMFRFFIGLGKKVIIANQFSEIAGDLLDGDLSKLSSPAAWIGLSAFAFQIFFDFSGYSDMAIGMGRCLGFHFDENFKHPYTCTTITDFWRKWHISLGTFFRDYIYIPLGGNRKHQIINILVVWMLTGMWHGASWNFILWGIYFGIIVTLEKYTLLKISRYIPNLLLRVYALLLVWIGWAIFYFDNLDRLSAYFQAATNIATLQFDFVAETALFNHFWLWIVAILFSMPLYKWVQTGYQNSFLQGNIIGTSISLILKTVISLVLFCVSIALLVGATNNAFIYTRF